MVRALHLRRLRAVLIWVEVVAGFGWTMAESGLARGAVWLPAILIGVAGVVVVSFGLRLAVKVGIGGRAFVRVSTFAVPALVLGLSLLWIRVAAAVAIGHDLYLVLRWLRRERPGRRILVDVGYRPARALLASFATLIGVGTTLLAFPASWGSAPVGVLDALFTATSATCVTGLTTLDTSGAWSVFGKTVILLLVQSGGLGIMAIAAATTLFFGRAMGLDTHAAVRGAFDEADAEELRALLRGLVISTFGIETIGALILASRFATEMPLDQALAYGFFHSISAFCNAGFALFSDNLTRYAADPTVSLTVSALVFLGGLGFGVLVGLYRLGRSAGRHRLQIHARVVLFTSGLLIWVGALAFFYFEYDGSLAQLPLSGKVLASLFQAITPRTAGFNTVAMGELRPVTVLLLIVLMFIGASPGSTGGGAKTSTVAIAYLAVRAYLGNRSDVEVYGRRLAPENVTRALAILGAYSVVYVLGVGVLLSTETAEFHALAFEAASALGTVGLSMDLTPLLSSAGKVVVIFLMFVGRVGPLTVAAAAGASGAATGAIRLPEGRVLVG
ncbi:MAG: Trk family potassium uptake protein [Deltaproteobacteria bacterium]|nr:Trk family potassium uptake protein [Deltaproteobacteria bacterium]